MGSMAGQKVGQGPPYDVPLIKVCGVMGPGDAMRAVELGADLLGLNFHPPSPRCLSPERAAEVAEAVRGRVPLVGVFVHLAGDEIAEIDRRVGLDLIQLHGEPDPEAAARWGERAIQVFRREEPPGAEEIARYPDVWGFLLDVPHGALYGGTGVSWQYENAAGMATDKPVLVAGGIRPGNARNALDASGAAGVDVCSGVESSPGVKDPDLIRRLIAEVRDG